MMSWNVLRTVLLAVGCLAVSFVSLGVAQEVELIEEVERERVTSQKQEQQAAERQLRMQQEQIERSVKEARERLEKEAKAQHEQIEEKIRSIRNRRQNRAKSRVTRRDRAAQRADRQSPHREVEERHVREAIEHLSAAGWSEEAIRLHDRLTSGRPHADRPPHADHDHPPHVGNAAFVPAEPRGAWGKFAEDQMRQVHQLLGTMSRTIEHLEERTRNTEQLGRAVDEAHRRIEETRQHAERHALELERNWNHRFEDLERHATQQFSEFQQHLQEMTREFQGAVEGVEERIEIEIRDDDDEDEEEDDDEDEEEDDDDDEEEDDDDDDEEDDDE